MWPLLLMAGSAVMQGYAQSKADKSAADAAKLNAIASRISTMFKVQDLRDAGERLESSQRAAYGKSGVDLTTGSAAEVQAESAKQIEKEIYRVKYTGGLQQSGQMTQADAFTKASNYAMIGGLLKGGATYISGAGKMSDIQVKQ